MPCADAKRKRYYKWRIDLAIHEAIRIARKRSFQGVFSTLLAVARSRTQLLRPSLNSGYAGWSGAEQSLRGMLALCEHRRGWLKTAASWEPGDATPAEQFRGLAQHLLARRPVPNFMTHVWLEPPSQTTKWRQRIYKHLGLGNSIRGAEIPLRLTKAMARHLPQVPDHLNVEQALRWCQVRGLRGTNQFAAAVAHTRLGSQFNNNAFWAGSIAFLIGQDDFNLKLVTPIIEYMHVNRGRLAVESFNKFSGRRFANLLDRVRSWQASNTQVGRWNHGSWPRTTIGGFRYHEETRLPWSARTWTIRELTRTEDLREEGRMLNHCVASYARHCLSRATSIWSLQRHRPLESERILTIEVWPKERTIVTALGRCNTLPKPEARRIMRQWAERERLKLAPWIQPR